MTSEDWREIARSAVHRDDAGDPKSLDLLAALLAEQDAAKNRLNVELNIGCIGRPWDGVVDDVADALLERRVVGQFGLKEPTSV